MAIRSTVLAMHFAWPDHWFKSIAQPVRRHNGQSRMQTVAEPSGCGVGSPSHSTTCQVRGAVVPGAVVPNFAASVGRQV
jgi:hypothetical protein